MIDVSPPGLGASVALRFSVLMALALLTASAPLKVPPKPRPCPERWQGLVGKYGRTGSDASDILIGSRSIAALAGGASSSGATAVTIPLGTSAGTWYIIAKADAGGAVAETWETNNNYPKSIKIN